jgi:protein SCO1/2
MRAESVVPGPSRKRTSNLDGPFWLVLALSVVLVGLVGLSAIRSAITPAADSAASSPPPASTASFLYPAPKAAPALALTDQDGQPFATDDLRGGPALVFFGYTHCPDVCPATMGILAQVATAYGSGLHVVFVTVDPERDTVAWLKEYIRFMPTGFTGLTGSATQIRATADAWGVRYARVEGGDAAGYSMAHTADVFVVDPAGRLVAHYPFGTDGTAMLASLRQIAAASAPVGSLTPTSTHPSPAPTGTAAPTEPAEVPELAVEVVSSSVWAGGASPAILALSGPGGPIADPHASVTVTLTSPDGAPSGVPTAAVAVQPPGETAVSYVVTLDIPTTGWWGLAVTAVSDGVTMAGATSVSALDPGSTAGLGRPAPSIATPTLDDVGGDALRITTDPLPDLRLSQVSTATALANGQPFVLIIDSARFKITTACGKALSLAKFMVDRWPDVPFVHLEPFAYDVVTDTPVLEGSLADPTLVPAAAAWGIGDAPWGASSMPWAFVVDGHGTVRAKYEGILGSDDLDVIIAMVKAGG